MPINPKKAGPLRPLPMRITELQWERLNAARDYDDIPIQEHVRRALDDYLDGVDRRRIRAAAVPLAPAGLPTIEAANASLAGATGAEPAKRRKVVYR